LQICLSPAYDLTVDPVDPPLLSECIGEIYGSECGIEMAGGYVYVAVHQGLGVFDVSDPRNVEYKGRLRPFDVLAIATDGKFVYVATPYDGLYVVI